MIITNVKMSEIGSSIMFIIKTKKYRRTILVSKQFPRLPNIDTKYVFETGKSYSKFRQEWVEAKKLNELIDTGNWDEFIRNSPKQQRLIKIGKYWK